MNHTLSTTQWQMLQDLFDRCEGLDKQATDALLAGARCEDPLVARSLQAMLDAHDFWRSRTNHAIEHLTREAQVSAVGSRLGAFRLVSEIGRGGMGVVYLGERIDGQVRQQVAIKVLHAQNLDANTRARFQREREILAEFDHPGIARLLDAGESPAGEPYFVMEYLRGLSITEHCDERRLNIRERLHLFLQLCDALQYAHAKLILHRDIKPGNVLVDNCGVLRLIDFGIAKPLGEMGDGQLDETAHAQRFFSPVNAAPEQIKGTSVAVACDVYQLGTLLYELLSGQKMFDLRGKSAAQIEEQICELSPCPPSNAAERGGELAAHARKLPGSGALRRTLTGDLDAIILRAVRKPPASRYASVDYLAADVRRYLGSRPILGRRGTSSYRVKRFVQRQWQSIGLVSLAAMGIVVFTALLIREQKRTEIERDAAVVESQRAHAVTEFLVDIFRNSGPNAEYGPESPIRLVLEKGQKLIEHRKQVDPRTRARLLGVLSRISSQLSDLESAEAQILDAIQLLEGAPIGDPLLLASHYEQASGVMRMLYKNYQSAKMAQRAVAIYKSLDLDVSSSWYAQLNVLRFQKITAPAAACEGMERLLSDISRQRDAPLLALSTILIDTSACRMSSTSGLEKNELELRDAMKLLLQSNDQEEADAFPLTKALFLTLKAKGQTEEANELLLEMLPVQIRMFGEESWRVAYTLQGLGEIAIDEARYAQAEEYLERARRIFSIVHEGSTTPDSAISDFAIARLQDVAHHNAQRSSELYSAALGLGLRAFGTDSLEVGVYSANYGVLLQRSDQLMQAEPLLRMAVRILPAINRDGARARIGLAGIHGARNELKLAAALLSEVEPLIPEIQRQDPRFTPEIAKLRAQIEADLNFAMH